MRNHLPLSTLAGSVAAALVLISCSSASPAAPAPPVVPESAAALPHIVVLGDSLAVSPSISDNFPSALQARLDAGGYRWKIINASTGGAVTADGVRRLESALTADTRILVLGLGANDGLRGVPIERIEENLATITERAQARGIRVLLCGMETPPAHGWDYTLAFHRLFPALASRYREPLVPFLLAGVALNASMNGADGIHPNGAGAQRIADTVWPHLEQLIQETQPVRSSASGA